MATERLYATLATAPMLDQQQVARLVREFYDSILERENAWRLSVSIPLGNIEVERRRAYYTDLARTSQEALASNRLDDVMWAARAMSHKLGINYGELSDAERAKAKQALLRAGIDVALALEARYRGDFNYEPADKLLKAVLAETAAPTTPINGAASIVTVPEAATAVSSLPPFSVASSQFGEEQVQTRAWENQTAAQARATFRLFVDVCGDKPLVAYTRKDAHAFREKVQRLPSAYGKAPIFKGLAVDDILALCARKPKLASPVIAQKTVKRHFSALSTLWTWAIAREDAIQNIFTGFQFSGVKKAVEQRSMWQKEELRGLFATPLWTGCLSMTHRSKPGTLIVKDEKFWLPLIAVYSGMRQEEICQLHVEDIREQDGIWFFDVNDRPPRRLKNKNSIRRVPIHHELIGRGFLDHVDAQRRAKHKRVFPDLIGGGADDRLGHAFTKWFTRYRRDVKLYRPGLDFHSFRHSATTFMHKAGVQDSVIDRVTGHATPGETARYTKETSLELLFEAIATIKLD